MGTPIPRDPSELAAEQAAAEAAQSESAAE
jgi:hypothetical protein